MSMLRNFTTGTAILMVSASLFSCSGTPPAHLGLSEAKLAPCPASPNCLCSDDLDSEHKIAPFQLVKPAAEVWLGARQLVAELPRTRITIETENYLHAECRSFLFGFVDDLELHLRPADGIIAIRSAARSGYADFGVNRRRIDTLRKSLIRLNMIH